MQPERPSPAAKQGAAQSAAAPPTGEHILRSYGNWQDIFQQPSCHPSMKDAMGVPWDHKQASITVGWCLVNQKI